MVLVSVTLSASVKYTIAKAVPKVEDFTFAAPKDLVYNGQAKSAEVKAKDSVKGMGNITVKYYQSETEVEPINAGRYIVKISVEEGTNLCYGHRPENRRADHQRGHSARGYRNG